MLLLSIGLKSTEKNFTLPFDPVFSFISLIVKSFEILPQQSFFFSLSSISEYFTLN